MGWQWLTGVTSSGWDGADLHRRKIKQKINKQAGDQSGRKQSMKLSNWSNQRGNDRATGRPINRLFGRYVRRRDGWMDGASEYWWKDSPEGEKWNQRLDERRWTPNISFALGGGGHFLRPVGHSLSAVTCHLSTKSISAVGKKSNFCSKKATVSINGATATEEEGGRDGWRVREASGLFPQQKPSLRGKQTRKQGGGNRTGGVHKHTRSIVSFIFNLSLV